MSKYCTSIYLCFLFLIFPLYYQNNYINILETKTAIFTIGTILYFIAILVCFWIESIQKYEQEMKLKGSEKRRKQRQSAIKVKQNSGKQWKTLFLYLFLAVLLLSSLASGDIVNAWHAPNTKMFGTKILVFCIGISFFFSKGFVWNRAVKGCLLFGLTIVFSLTVLNRFNIDPLGMYSNLIEEQWPIYLSTIGNANILSNYICVFLPLVMGMFLYADNLREKVIYGILTVLGVMAGICTNSDSFFLGFGSGLIVYLWFALTTQKHIQEFIKVCILCGVAMLGLKIISAASSFDVPWEKIQAFLINDIRWIVVLLGLGLLYFITCRVTAEKTYLQTRKALYILLAVGTAILLLYVIKVNFIGVDGPKALIFNDRWGTNRGYVWRNTIELFGELPLYQKLIGIGPGKFYDFFAVPNEIRVKPFVDPHSDYLYYFVTFGIIGFVSWLGMIVSAIVSCLKRRGTPEIIIAAILFAWLAQATVNTSLVFTAPYLFIALGLARWYEKSS